MIKYFATADWHYDHKNIIRYCNRPFLDVREMNREIVERYNNAVDENSIVFHLGDVSMTGPSRYAFYEDLATKLRKVKAAHLILGNHDELKASAYISCGLFDSVHTSFWMPYEGQNIFMVHDPAVYQPAIYDKICFCGHIHNLFRYIQRGAGITNVGVDVRDFAPVSFETLISELTIKE